MIESVRPGWGSKSMQKCVTVDDLREWLKINGAQVEVASLALTPECLNQLTSDLHAHMDNSLLAEEDDNKILGLDVDKLIKQKQKLSLGTGFTSTGHTGEELKDTPMKTEDPSDASGSQSS